MYIEASFHMQLFSWKTSWRRFVYDGLCVNNWNV